jgi:archaellum component FlaC
MRVLGMKTVDSVMKQFTKITADLQGIVAKMDGGIEKATEEIEVLETNVETMVTERNRATLGIDKLKEFLV